MRIRVFADCTWLPPMTVEARRRFITGLAVLGVGAVVSGGARVFERTGPGVRKEMPEYGKDRVRLFLCGDVMTGRGIDQILPHPAPPRLYEPLVQDAREYVMLAEDVNGPVGRAVAYDYIWGNALGVLARARPDVRIVNLETAITRSEHAWPGKGINYRMDPANLSCLTVAGIDCCTLANNHVLDWGYDGLAETLSSLHGAGIRTAGAGEDEAAAAAAAVLQTAGNGRVLVFAGGDGSSGIPEAWAARGERAGVNRLRGIDDAEATRIAAGIAAIRCPRDVVLFSVHWGPNWGYEVPDAYRQFARRLIDAGCVDIVCGHSSHHPKGMEVYRKRLILYGCGDLLNDYEGIRGYEAYRSDLALMYFADCDAATGELLALTLEPVRRRRLRLEHAAHEASQWLAVTLNQASSEFGTYTAVQPDGSLAVRWR